MQNVGVLILFVDLSLQNYLQTLPQTLIQSFPNPTLTSFLQMFQNQTLI